MLILCKIFKVLILQAMFGNNIVHIVLNVGIYMFLSVRGNIAVFVFIFLSAIKEEAITALEIGTVIIKPFLPLYNKHIIQSGQRP